MTHARYIFVRETTIRPARYLSEVIALVQEVEGVVAVDIDSLYRTGETVKLNSRLEAELPHGGDPASLGAAELLTVDPAPIDLEVMP
jgi:hypothetical protein